MPKFFGDESGLFWFDEIVSRSNATRILPPLPETLDWRLPDEFPDLSDQGAIAIDCETQDKELRQRGPGAHRDGQLVGIAVGTEAGFRRYYPFDHEQGPNLEKRKVLDWLGVQLARPGQPKVGANLLYDLDYLTVAGLHITGPFYDIQVAEPLLDETQLSYSLNSIAQRQLGETKTEEIMTTWLTRAFGDADNLKGNIWRAPPAVVGPYAEGDVDLPLRIFTKQRQQLESQGLWDLFLLESKLIPLLLRMRQHGVRVDLKAADLLSKSMATELQMIRGNIKHKYGSCPDIWASSSLARMFDSLNIDYPRTEKTNAPSFRKDWLTYHPHDFSKGIQRLRVLDKLKSTFVDGTVLSHHVVGRIHCQFNQLRSDAGGTVSGRFSSTKPNLQQVPIRDAEFGDQIRSLFIPEQEHIWCRNDWSQIEYRLIASYAALTKQPGIGPIIERYRTDPATDYHQAVADLTGQPREVAKSLNFGLAYGEGVDKLCAILGLSRLEGERIINEYHRRAPFIRPLARLASARAEFKGEIKTLLGRRRRFNSYEYNGHFYPSYMNHPLLARRAYTHKALNALIQGSAADIMKTAMVQIWEAGLCEVLIPHLTVHDEIDLSMPQTAVGREAAAELKHLMTSCVQLQVPMIVDQSFGSSWGETK